MLNSTSLAMPNRTCKYPDMLGKTWLVLHIKLSLLKEGGLKHLPTMRSGIQRAFALQCILTMLLHEIISGVLDCSSNLCCKHRAWRDFHVMSELEIRQKIDSLFRSTVAISLEAHVGDRLTRQNKSYDVFGNDVQSWCLHS